MNEGASLVGLSICVGYLQYHKKSLSGTIYKRFCCREEISIVSNSVSNVFAMAYAILSWLQNLWPFSIHETDEDLKASDGLVHGLLIPDQTKQFVFAVRNPEIQAVIYLLAAQNLSEQSSVSDGQIVIFISSFIYHCQMIQKEDL